MALLEVNNLVKHFPVKGGLFNTTVAKVHAVNDVSLRIHKGEVLGIVGESGCGKSTLGRLITRLYPATSGQIIYDGNDLTYRSYGEMRKFRKRIQIIFQDPSSSLNPRMTVGTMLKEVIKFHKVVGPGEVNAYIDSMIDKVGLPGDARGKYPHEFSGGQKQRIGIARALAVQPDFIVADEPISALDVSIQAQILNLLMDLKEEFGLTIMFISHDLKVVSHFCDRMLVMYLGKIVEELRCDDIHSEALHPYTKALLGANPVDDPDDRKELTILEGEVPSPYDPPPGCPFVTRCPIVEEQCHQAMPPLEFKDARNEQLVACYKVEKALKS
ncbi:MAG: oligopeptide/dipeptide ABC transporter ATP-binding protein [Pirellulaceae bacterium]|jgi:oligopeptide/dipeptide ABC transporter ATP-binding protein